MRRFGYNPDRPVGRDNPIPKRLIDNLADAALVEEREITGAIRRWRSPLTERELEVLRYLSRGLTRRMVAELLFIEEQTVMNHVKNARFKLKAKNITHACCEAIRQGVIP